MQLNLFNRWRQYPKYKPEESGWYVCAIRFHFCGDEYQSYVMDLYWDSDKEIWKDNRRLNVFELYDVYGYGTENEKIKLYKDGSCYRDDVIAWKKCPSIYRDKKYKLYEVIDEEKEEC